MRSWSRPRRQPSVWHAAATGLGGGPLHEHCHPDELYSPLFAREIEVAGLVAKGFTNREMAQRLYISERTAENHVKNILDKLALNPPAQIAAWIVGKSAN